MSNFSAVPESRGLTIAEWRVGGEVTHFGGDNNDVDDSVWGYEAAATLERRSYIITEESDVFGMSEGASLADQPEQLPAPQIATTDVMTWRTPYLAGMAPKVGRLPAEAFFRVMGYRHGLRTYEDVLRLGVLGLVQEKKVGPTEVAWLMRIVQSQTGERVSIHGRVNESQAPTTDEPS